MQKNNWKEFQLKDFIDIKHGFAFPGKNITDQETDKILVTPGHFSLGGGFKNNHKKFYNADFPKEYLLKQDDLIVTMTDLSKKGDTLREYIFIDLYNLIMNKKLNDVQNYIKNIKLSDY